MSINEFHPFDDTELIRSGFTQEEYFTSGHFAGAVYRPPDYDPTEIEQYRSYYGVVDESIDCDRDIPPRDHADHVNKICDHINAYLLSIGDI